MVDLVVEERVKYPPFEPNRWEPQALPLAVQRSVIGTYESKDEAMNELKQRAPMFTLGGEDTWMVEHRYFIGDELVESISESSWVDQRPYPNVVKRQRRGWYLLPNPFHNIVRKFINSVVILLLIALAYLAISPILIMFNIPVYGIRTVRLGLLDYPVLATFVVPLIFLPLMIRVFANLIELKRQNTFLQRNLKDPIISFQQTSVTDQPLAIEIEFPEWDDEWNHVDVFWRVGVLPPSREALLKTLNRKANTQPPPGLSTELPHHWEEGLDDGTAGGEDAPMEIQEVKGGLYLRPMRIMASGGTQRWKKGETVSLDPPNPIWPGTFKSELIRVHWECILRIDRQRGGALFWVQPLNVAHHSHQTSLEHLPLYDGRSESDLR